MAERRFNTPEYKKIAPPDFDPQTFATNIRAEYSKAIIKELPSELYESVKQDGLLLGIDNEVFAILKAIAIMSRVYIEHNTITKGYSPEYASISKSKTASTKIVKPKSEVIQIYTDGACKENPGPGGWSAIVIHQDGSEQVYCGGDPNTTNNRMELMAPIMALETLSKPSVVEIYSDAKYVVDGIEKGWARSWKASGWMRANGPAINSDLWDRLLKAIDDHIKVTFLWIKSHSGNPYNMRCDKLATDAAAKAK